MLHMSYGHMYINGRSDFSLRLTLYMRCQSVYYALDGFIIFHKNLYYIRLIIYYIHVLRICVLRRCRLNYFLFKLLHCLSCYHKDHLKINKYPINMSASTRFLQLNILCNCIIKINKCIQHKGIASFQARGSWELGGGSFTELARK